MARGACGLRARRACGFLTSPHTSDQGGVISGSVSATMEDVTAPEMATHTASAGGPFTVPLRIVP